MKKQTTAVIISALLLVFALIACNSNSEKTETEAIQPTVPEIKSVFVNGDSLHYVDVGNGETIILIHGTLGDYRQWLPFLDTFSKNHRVIAYSRRYAYPNKQVINDSADYSVIPHAEDLASFIQSLNVGPVHLVGHSYGGFTALLTTLKYPELVKTVTLGEPPVAPLLMSLPGGDTIANKFFAIVKPASEAFKSGNDEKAVSIFAAWVIGDSNFYKSLPAEARSAMLANTLELRGSLLSNKPFPEVKCEDLKKIQTPVLLIQGEKTTPFFSTIVDEAAKCLAKKEKTILPGATHGLQRDNPGEFNKIVLSFIDKH